MNLSNILTEIEKTDPEIYERTSMRRDVIKNWSRKVALTALPFALGSLFKKAYGKTNDIIVDTLNFALTLEYLESEFYSTALNTSGLIPSGDARNAIQIISNHETSHVNFLKAAISGAGGSAVAKPTFDFTGGNGSNLGPYAGVFLSYSTFLELAQTFEDTGVRAYKGQAGNLMSNNDVLTAALNIHSVEARHASHIRKIRNAQLLTTVKPWIIQNQSGTLNTASQASYDGEENTQQAGIEITNINGQHISSNAATEAFDEPLTKQQVLNIVDGFIV